MRRWKHITLGVTGAVLLACIATLVVGVLLLTATPGPRPNYGEEIMAINESLRPTPDAPDGWPLLVDLAVQIHEASALVEDPSLSEDDLPDFRRLYAPDISVEEDRALREFTFLHRFNVPVASGGDVHPHAEIAKDWLILNRLADDRCRDTLDMIGRCEWMAPPYVADTTIAFRTGRALARFLMYRMHFAWQGGRAEDAVRCFRAALAIERMHLHQPYALHHMLAGALSDLVQRRVLRMITESPPDEALAAAMLDALADVDDPPHWSVAFPGDRFILRDWINATYSGNPGGDGRFLPASHRLLWDGSSDDASLAMTLEQRIENLNGFLAPSRTEFEGIVETMYDELIERGAEVTRKDILRIEQDAIAALAAAAPRYAEVSQPIANIYGTGSLFEDQLSLHKYLVMKRVRERRRATFDVIRAALLIERRRRMTGAYPETLAAIEDPRLLRDVLPFWLQPLEYRRLDPDRDLHGRGYELSVRAGQPIDATGAAAIHVGSALSPDAVTFTDWQIPTNPETAPVPMTPDELDALAREYMSRQHTPSDTSDDP